jgi:hypothetical protein
MLAARPGRVSGLARLLPLVTAVALAFGVLALGAGTAHADTGYKYWNYFHVENGKYVFAKTGPSGYTPRNGSVEAFRYGLSTGTSSGLQPRTEPTTYSFDDVCAGAKAQSGQKRVGVLIDYGAQAEAPSGETPPKPRAACAVVPAKASGQGVLETVAKVRLQKDFLCGIDGYPAKGCSVTVKNAPSKVQQSNVDFTMPKVTGTSAKTTNAAGQGRGVPWALIGVIVILVVLVGSALLLARRRANP